MTLLVVDDYDANRVLLQDVLESEGFRVLEACDGNEALHLLDFECPSVILLDLKMPGCDGRELLAKLKANRRLSPIPVVLVTADKDASLLTGVAALVKKPFELGYLVETVKRCAGMAA